MSNRVTPVLGGIYIGNSGVPRKVVSITQGIDGHYVKMERVDPPLERLPLLHVELVNHQLPAAWSEWEPEPETFRELAYSVVADEDKAADILADLFASVNNDLIRHTSSARTAGIRWRSLDSLQERIAKAGHGD